MLIILVAAACLGLVLVALSLCRAAAISDRSHPLAKFEWTASDRLEQEGALDASSPAEAPPLTTRSRTRRAAG